MGNFTPQRTFIIAELSANHGQSIDNAIKTVIAAKEAGADAIKIQTYTPDTITLNIANDFFKIRQNTIWDGQTLYDLYKEAYTPWEWHAAIQEEANKQGLVFFSTPFDKSSVDFLKTLNIPIYKIASFEITDIPLIEYVACIGKPILISTGIATLSEIQDAVNACRKMGNNNITLLKCTSSYPTPVSQVNLRTMVNLAETFQVKIGLSDHTLGHSVALAAVTLGASVIEKHFIIDKTIGGPDASFSMTPEEFKVMVKGIREVESSLGTVDYELSEQTKTNRKFARSLFVTCDIKKGEIFTTENIRSVRPSDGLPPKYLPNILGRKAKNDLVPGMPLSWNDII